VIRRLQALRFVAAALVLVGHTFMEAVQHGLALGSAERLTRLPWGVGVDVFFVISGFIIATASLDKPRGGESVIDFLAHRLIRVWPTYAFFTALMLAAVLLVPSFLRHATLSVSHTLASFVFLPWPRPGDGHLYPLLGQGWTLNYEMFFYLAFAAVLFLPARRRVPALVLSGIALIALGQFATLPPWLTFYSRPVIAEFLFGVLLSVAYRRFAPPPWFGFALIAAAVAFLAIVPIDTEVEWRSIGAGLPAAALVAGTLFSGMPGERLLGSRLLVLLGDASYALYLCHTFVVNAVLWLLLKLLGHAPTALFFFTAVVGSLIASVVTYWLVEQPFLRLLKPRYRALRARVPGRDARSGVAPLS
jgi:peptidoglycan/LPS O-acetylase OafA/YrhL